MEAGEIILYMFFACAFATSLQHPASPVRHLITDSFSRRAIMGLSIGATVIAIVMSPLGKRSGGHFNPAITFTFFRLKKVARWDAVFYATEQFLGAIATQVLHGAPNNDAVRYAVTAPGGAFMGELTISFILMATILLVSTRETAKSDVPPCRFTYRCLCFVFKEIIMAAQEIPLAYQSKLVSRVEVAEGTMAFHFEKPLGFEFKPGQSCDLTLMNPPETDSEGNVRTFSIASAPFEDRLMFATRMRDTAFKRSLKTAPLGTPLKMEPATGSFTLHKNSAKPAVLLAGGIGITPFFSIVKQADHERLPHKSYLFYSNRRPEDAPFLENLHNLEKNNPNFRFIATMTEMPRSTRKWEGETGLIDKAMLSRYVSDLRSPIFYIAGPPGMVREMQKMLVASCVDEDDIRTDAFAGY